MKKRMKIGSCTFNGFTLVEIMIVMTVIALLASFIAPALDRALKNARDMQRIKDIDTYISMIEVYAANEGIYPEGDSSGVHLDDDCASNIKTALTTSQYLSDFPEDPLGKDTSCADDSDEAFFYGWDSDHSCDGSKYCISINNLETIEGQEVLIKKFGKIKFTTCGSDANINDADFNYCIVSP